MKTVHMASPRRIARSTGEVVPKMVLALFCVYIMAWFLQVGVRVDILGTLRFEMVLGTLLTVLAIGLLAKVPVRAGRDGNRVAVAAAALLLTISIQVPFSFDPTTSWIVYIERVIKFAFVAVFIVAFVKSVRDMRWFVVSFLLACAFICQESFRGALSGSMVWENQGIPRLHGDTPLFRHPNSLGGLAIGVLPFSYFIFRWTQRRVVRFALLALSAIALGVIMYSGSRTAYVGVIALGVYFLAAAKVRFTKALVIGIAAVGIAAVAMPDAYKARFGTIATGQEIEGNSMGARRQILKDAIEMFSESPFGVGVSAFPAKRLEMFGRMPDTHNLYLQVATNLGVQGLIAFLALVYVLWTSLSRLIARLSVAAQEALASTDRSGTAANHKLIQSDDWLFSLAVARATQAYLLARLVLGLFGHDLYDIYWWIVTGLTIALASITNRFGAPDSLKGRARNRRQLDPVNNVQVQGNMGNGKRR